MAYPKKIGAKKRKPKIPTKTQTSPPSPTRSTNSKQVESSILDEIVEAIENVIMCTPIPGHPDYRVGKRLTINQTFAVQFLYLLFRIVLTIALLAPLF